MNQLAEVALLPRHCSAQNCVLGDDKVLVGARVDAAFFGSSLWVCNNEAFDVLKSYGLLGYFKYKENIIRQHGEHRCRKADKGLEAPSCGICRHDSQYG